MKRRAKREERDKLEKLVADGEELSVEDRARLELLQSAKKRKNETQRLKRHARREEHDTLEKSVEDGVKLAPEEQTRLDVHQSAREKVNETQRLKRHVKRQKRQEEATNQEHPMMKLILVNSGGNKSSPKLIQLVSDGTLKIVLTSYFVTGQTMKLSDKFLKSVDGCKEVSRHLIISCLDHHIPKLSTMKGIISCAKPLSMDNSNHAQQIILQLFPE